MPPDTEGSRLFVLERRVPWGDADPAGTLYFAHVCRYCMEASEEWFVQRLGTDWHRINLERGIGTPMVRTEIDFTNPAMAGEVLELIVAVERVGRSSLVLRVQGRVKDTDRVCWQGRFTCVFMDAATRRSIAIPDEYRGVMETELRRGPGVDASSSP